MSAIGLKTGLRDGIRALTPANPPGNALTPVLSAALLDEIAAAADVSAVVLQAEGPAFSSHQPLDPDAEEPSLSALCRTQRPIRDGWTQAALDEERPIPAEPPRPPPQDPAPTGRRRPG